MRLQKTSLGSAALLVLLLVRAHHRSSFVNLGGHADTHGPYYVRAFSAAPTTTTRTPRTRTAGTTTPPRGEGERRETRHAGVRFSRARRLVQRGSDFVFAMTTAKSSETDEEGSSGGRSNDLPAIATTTTTTTTATKTTITTRADDDDDSTRNDNADDASAAAMPSTNASTTMAIAQSVLGIDPEQLEIVNMDKNINNNGVFNDDNDTNGFNSEPGAAATQPQQQRQKQQQPQQPPSAELIRKLPFVSMFRGSANYIASHRNTIAVYHIPGSLVALSKTSTQNHDNDDNDNVVNGGGGDTTGDVFRDVMNDIALTWLLGMKIVLVVGCRDQIEKRLAEQRRQRRHAHRREPDELSHDLRVTDEDTLRIVKEEAGYVRFEVERQLARSVRMQGESTMNPRGGRTGGSNNGQNHHQHHVEGNVVSGNFYSAQPMGIIDGVDYKYTGFVRRVEVDKIRQLHASRDICLMTTLGVSPSGEVFNVNSESLAAAAAGALCASKVIYFTRHEMELRHKQHQTRVQSLRLSDAKHLLQYHGMVMHRKGHVTYDGAATEKEEAEDEQASASNDDAPQQSSSSEKRMRQRPQERLDDSGVDMLQRIGWSTIAVGDGGVKRAHIITPKHGALLQELYTRDGSGMLISGDIYEGFRRATVHDVNQLYQLISPLIAAGTLIDRPKAVLEQEIEQYHVYTRDNTVVACGQLKQFENGFAEIGCLVVSREFRARGRGDAMLGYLKQISLANGCSSIFVLSTQTMEWFVERGFDAVTVDKLPPSRQATYNHKRRSKIYMMNVTSARDLDASELWWNR